MAKKVVGQVKLQIPAGKGQESQSQAGTVIPVVITVYADRSFSFIMKVPPAAILIKEAMKIEKGSGDHKKVRAGQIKRSKVREIAKRKLVDLNAYDVDAAMKIIEGTARSMGVDVIEG